jgi:hypothetical protein
MKCSPKPLEKGSYRFNPITKKKEKMKNSRVKENLMKNDQSL